MNATSRVTLRWPLLIAGALVCLALGAGSRTSFCDPRQRLRATCRQARIGVEQPAGNGGTADGARGCHVA